MTNDRKRPVNVKGDRSVPTRVASDARGRGRWWFWVAITAAGLALRIALLPVSPRLYPSDHDDFVRWGMQAADRGVLSLYDGPPARHDSRTWRDGQWVVGQRALDRVCNYPPASAYLLYVSGTVFRAVSADRLINTVTSHAVFSSWSILADFVVAAGCAAVVGVLRSRRAGYWAYALMVFAPPMWWDSVVWGQVDAVLLAPAIWMVYAMLRGRWITAGVLWGLALALKPQGILFVPLWAFVLLVGRPLWRAWLGAGVAGAVLLLVALPFTVHSGWAWFRLSYWENLFASSYASYTTLFAFNVWYLHSLLTDSRDASLAWLGLTRGGWGKLWLATGLLAGFVFTLCRRRRARTAPVWWTAVSLLLFVMLPTEVHERYLVLLLPFLAVGVGLSRRLWPALVLLVIVMMGQMSWPLWLRTPPGVWPQIEQQMRQGHAQAVARLPGDSRQKVPDVAEMLEARHAEYRRARAVSERYEWLLTIMALVAAGMTLAVFATAAPRDEAGPTGGDLGVRTKTARGRAFARPRTGE